MLWTIVVVLLILWLLGVVALPSVGALIHILLVLALIVLIFQLLSGRRTVLRSSLRSTRGPRPHRSRSFCARRILDGQPARQTLAEGRRRERRLTASLEIGNVSALARSGEDLERQGRSVAMDLLSDFVRSGASGARPRSTLPISGPS